MEAGKCSADASAYFGRLNLSRCQVLVCQKLLNAAVGEAGLVVQERQVAYAKLLTRLHPDQTQISCWFSLLSKQQLVRSKLSL